MEFDPLSSSSRNAAEELSQKELTGVSAVLPSHQVAETDSPTVGDTRESAGNKGDKSSDVLAPQMRSGPEDLKTVAPPPNPTEPEDVSNKPSAAIPMVPPSSTVISSPEKTETSSLMESSTSKPSHVSPAKPPLPPGVAQNEQQRKLSKRKKKKKHKRSSISSPSQGKASSRDGKMSNESITSQMNEIDAFLQSLKMGGGLPGVAGLAPPSTGAVLASHSHLAQESSGPALSEPTTAASLHPRMDTVGVIRWLSW